MAKKELIDDQAKNTRAHALAARLRKTHPDVSTAGECVTNWKYVDFCDPRNGARPVISLEWLFGARGLLAGRLINLIATYSKGKSSFMYFMYACAQRLLSGAWCCHLESEGAPAPADFIASYGADPDDLLIAGKTSLEDCMEWIDETEATIRGQWGEGIDPETGRKAKTKFTDPLDPGIERPIIMGIDSLSSLGLQDRVQQDVIDATKSAQPGAHAKRLREYLRSRVGRFNQRQLLLMLASHETKKIEMGGGGGGMKAKGADVTSLARDAVGIQATYEVTITSKVWRDKNPPYTKYGDIITFHTDKNKIAPRWRDLDLYLRTGSGFDMVMTDTEWFLTNPESPFVNPQMTPVFGTLSKYGDTITCPLLQEKRFATREEFLAALYARTDIVDGIRQWLRIRGFGFPFETEFRNRELPETESAKPETEAGNAPVAET